MKRSGRKKRKIGRNDPCWCRSGKKFKHCHLDRERQEPQLIWEAESKFRKAFSAKTCLAPDAWKHECTEQISKAHTVPRSGSLTRIAREGHVYSFVPSIEKLRKNNGLLVPQLRGINYASTFSGFCARHDEAIFAPLEKTTFLGTPEQCFLLGYRALAHEIYKKQASASLSEIRRQADRGKPLHVQIAIQGIIFPFNLGVAAAVRDLKHYKSIYDDVLVNRRFGDVRAYILETDKPPPVMCSGVVSPEQDFEGNILQDISDLLKIPHLLNFASFYGGNYGAVVFTWLPESDETCRAFIQTLDRVPIGGLTDALLRFFFEVCENLHMQPEWWEQLPPDIKDAIVRRMTTSADPEMARSDGCLKDDGVRFPPWSIRRRRLLGFSL
ncbi:MAG TPA: SEC-C metal-binding domain-containing protein [Syntrophales bacterium]|nr:SEC-C metal-binding domain-containing protein [Syntrophales bacterium]